MPSPPTHGPSLAHARETRWRIPSDVHPHARPVNTDAWRILSTMRARTPMHSSLLQVIPFPFPLPACACAFAIPDAHTRCVCPSRPPYPHAPAASSTPCRRRLRHASLLTHRPFVPPLNTAANVNVLESSSSAAPTSTSASASALTPTSTPSPSAPTTPSANSSSNSPASTPTSLVFCRRAGRPPAHVDAEQLAPRAAFARAPAPHIARAEQLARESARVRPRALTIARSGSGSKRTSRVLAGARHRQSRSISAADVEGEFVHASESVPASVPASVSSATITDSRQGDVGPGVPAARDPALVPDSYIVLVLVRGEGEREADAHARLLRYRDWVERERIRQAEEEAAQLAAQEGTGQDSPHSSEEGDYEDAQPGDEGGRLVHT
ncbi:hypothetical protein DFH06DRAFT_1482872 [Mycena polygramma]|nr:hypothetical protein DFH06DRAFT_1482872 [Mycena polygramma]